MALTLRLLGGLTVEEIARAFLATESTVAKRLVRAKHKIAAARIPYRVPDGAELPSRLRAVSAVVYLIYTTGIGDPVRDPLRGETIRLARALVEMVPDEPEATGLLALLLLNESRAAARFDDGVPVLLRDQIDPVGPDPDGRGHALVRSCMGLDRAGPLPAPGGDPGRALCCRVLRRH